MIFKDDLVFICRRKEGKSLSGYWEFPGGKIEENETDQVALTRELLEELDMKVLVKDFIGQSHYDYGSFKIELIGYACTLVEYQGKLTDHDAFEWVSIEDLSSYKLAPADIPFLKMINPENI
ncbi:(deoxy)nucleoside triphosphate pyrophosphohydrolase [Aestuariibaculum sp. M13]|uniref:(deoxy)nucleoside triphosphate pyrophosphohydrolase n=1 Tax=Aestuariibaculum sp. M13 TaxID=2967132 RepID=UPI002159EEEB|nr:(deoxy)nucleoside triphosphate pyrophosphohydrolase [Aestuariibaculum sp. M13]MCR8666240.1 (deoxy)nucleoside triphosphate pyrophosphohydrolase [Aestuariibaculum sp. M13]